MRRSSPMACGVYTSGPPRDVAATIARQPLPHPRPPDAPGLVRGLGVWDGVLITIGSIVGTGIFLTTSDVARALPHAGLVLLAWTAGGPLPAAGGRPYGGVGGGGP